MNSLLDQDPSFLDSIGPQASETSNDAGTVNVTICVDGDCFLMCDGDFIDAEFKANKITKIELATGQHFLQFQSAADTSIVVKRDVDYPEKGKSYLLRVQGLGEKSKEEKQGDTIAKFKQEVQKRLDNDRRIDGKEAAELEEIRKKLGLDVKTAQTLINDARRQMRQDSRGTVVREGNTFSIDILKEAILKNDADKIRTILPDVAAAIEASDQESDESMAIQCLYYMCMTALEPKALIQMHESSYVDNYWRTYWVFIAYSRNKQRAKAADTLADLQDIYLDYPDDNVDLLRAIDAYNNIGKKEAMQCVNWVDGNFSTELVSLAEAVRYELGIEKPATRQKEAQVAFIQDNIVSFEDLAIRMKRKEQEEAELRRKVTYTLTITEVKDQMMAMMVARTTLGWGASDSRKKFADLPVVAMVTESKADAMSVYSKLSEGKIIVEVKGVNGLNETVDRTAEFIAQLKAGKEKEQRRIEAENAAKKKAEDEKQRRIKAENAAKKKAEEEERQRREKENSFSVDKTKFTVPSNGDTISIKVTCITKYDFYIKPASWIQTINKDNGELRLKIAPNDKVKNRSDYFKIKSGDKVIRIDIEQCKAQFHHSGTQRHINMNEMKVLSQELSDQLRNNKDSKWRIAAITIQGEGVLIKGKNGAYASKLIKECKDFIWETNRRITDVCVSFSDDFVVIVDEKDYICSDNDGPIAKWLKKYHDRGDKITGISREDTLIYASWAIVTDKSWIASNDEYTSACKKAISLYGELHKVFTCYKGICCICERGAYYENLPSTVVNAFNKLSFIPYNVFCTENGHFFIADKNGDNFIANLGDGEISYSADDDDLL